MSEEAIKLALKLEMYEEKFLHHFTRHTDPKHFI